MINLKNILNKNFLSFFVFSEAGLKSSKHSEAGEASADPAEPESI